MKKRTFLVALCLVVALLPLTAMAETMYVVTSNGGGVNLREGPSTDDAVLVTVPYGAAVDVINTLVGSSWVNVNYNGYFGYIMWRYLSEYPPSPDPIPTFVPAPTARPTHRPTARPNPTHASDSLEKILQGLYAGFVTTSYTAVVVPSTPTTYVNLRWAPSKSAPVRNQYWAGATLQVLSENGTWAEVYDALNGIHGFMMSSFLKPDAVGIIGGSDS